LPRRLYVTSGHVDMPIYSQTSRDAGIVGENLSMQMKPAIALLGMAAAMR